MPARRSMTVKAALEWAFGTEKAGLVLPDPRPVEERAYAGGRDTLAVIEQQGALGCRVDTSRGRSYPAEGADLIAETVSLLPPELGGRRMALVVAECARAGVAPDTLSGEVPCYAPRGWHYNQNGRRAETESLGFVTVEKRSRRRVRRIEVDVRWCPMVLSPDPREISSARRSYLAWREALRWLAGELRAPLRGHGIDLARSLPKARPWTRLAPGWERLIEEAVL